MIGDATAETTRMIRPFGPVRHWSGALPAGAALGMTAVRWEQL
jgi:hypothetical protein